MLSCSKLHSIFHIFNKLQSYTLQAQSFSSLPLRWKVKKNMFYVSWHNFDALCSVHIKDIRAGLLMWQDKVRQTVKPAREVIFKSPAHPSVMPIKITVKITKRIWMNPEAGQLFCARLCTSWDFFIFHQQIFLLSPVSPLALLCLLFFASTHFPSLLQPSLSSGWLLSSSFRILSFNLPPSFPSFSCLCLLSLLLLTLPPVIVSKPSHYSRPFLPELWRLLTNQTI